MTWRRAIVLPVLAAVAVAGCGHAAAPSAKAPVHRAAAGRPNVVLVLTDDLSWNLVRYMPHVRALQRRGLTFTNYTVTDSLCCPSRSSMFSGRYPHDTGVFTNTGSDGGFKVFHARHEERSTFATDLSGTGYRTALMGKYLNGYEPVGDASTPRAYTPPGWSEWDVAGNGYFEFDYAMAQDGHVVRYGALPRDYLTDVIAARGRRFIANSAAAGRPFLLEEATFAPHAPYVPAPRDAGAFPAAREARTPSFDRRNIAAPLWLRSIPPLSPMDVIEIDHAFRRRVESVRAVDRMIGRLEATLRARGQLRNTYIVFTSDNGYHMGQHDLMPGKLTAFDSDVRVPLIVAGPGVPGGRTTAAIAENVDLRPTLDALAGAPAPPKVDGRSLVPLLQGRTPPGWRTAALIEHHGPDIDPRDPDHPSLHGGNPTTYEAIRTAQATYVEYRDGEREYYDRLQDPAERDNVVAQVAPDVIGRLHAMLDALRTCHGAAACWAAAGGR
jgi:N-acetylglucosamine-6-sulfatase